MLVAWIRLITLVVAIAIAPAAQETVPGLGAGRAVAPGVLHFTLTDPALLESPGADLGAAAPPGPERRST